MAVCPGGPQKRVETKKGWAEKPCMRCGAGDRGDCRAGDRGDGWVGGRWLSRWLSGMTEPMTFRPEICCVCPVQQPHGQYRRWHRWALGIRLAAASNEMEMVCQRQAALAHKPEALVDSNAFPPLTEKFARRQTTKSSLPETSLDRRPGTSRKELAQRTLMKITWPDCTSRSPVMPEDRRRWRSHLRSPTPMRNLWTWSRWRSSLQQSQQQNKSLLMTTDDDDLKGFPWIRMN